MILYEFRIFRYFVLSGIIGSCIWVFFWLMPSMGVYKIGNAAQTSNSSVAITRFKNGKVSDMVPVE